MLLDLEKEIWHKPLLEQLGIPFSILPKICSNCEIFGVVKNGSLNGVPIAGSMGDQHAALLGREQFQTYIDGVSGQRCREGEAKNTYGTGCFLLLNTGDRIVPSTHGLITGIGFKLGPDAPTQFMLEGNASFFVVFESFSGSVAVGGSIFSWLRDNLGLIHSVEEIEDLAKSVDDTSGVYFIPAFSGLLAPYWRDDARGVIVGLTGKKDRCKMRSNGFRIYEESAYCACGDGGHLFSNSRSLGRDEIGCTI